MINDKYLNMVLDIYLNGKDIKSRGLKAREIINYTIKLDPNDNIITLSGFETNIKYANEELNWYLSGSDKFTFSPLIEKIWRKYSNDGISVNSAYGWFFFSQKTPTNQTQWEWVKNELMEDPDSRRCVFNMNNVNHKEKNSKDIPCTVFCQVMIRNNELIWLTYMRSNDVFYGFRNDIYCFTELQKRLAQELGIKAGAYYHTSGSMHLYESEYEKVEKIWVATR